MNKLSLLIILAIVSCLIFSVSAQDNNNALLNKLVEKNVLTQQEADSLKLETNNETPQTSIIEKSSQNIRSIFRNTPYFQLGGYGLLLYRYKEYAPNHNNFQARLVYLSAKGNLTKNLEYYILFELTDPMLYEYYMNWKPVNELNLRAGQMKVPFTLENQLSLTKLETIYYTRSVSALAGMGDDVQTLNNGINKTGRDIGIQIFGSLFNQGDHNLLHYATGVFQGEGMNVSDKNNHKDFAGTLLLEPLKGLRIGGSVYAGQATYIKVNEANQRSHIRNRWALSAEYVNNNIELRTEWIKGNDGGISKEGLYGTGTWYFIPKKINIVGKVDYYNKNKDLHAEVMDYTAGINYYFYNQCRIMLDYTYSAYSKKWGGNHRGENAIMAQVQVVF